MIERTTTRVFFLTLLTALTMGPSLAMASETAVAATVMAAAPITEASFESEITHFETRFRTWGRNRRRAQNVELAAKLLNGSVIEPGETLSFNETVGERSAERGFVSAPVIANGRIRQGLGGGVCQVSSTLHVAALKAGLEIVEHRTHSRPSSYVDAGLDATVSWGTIDYKVRNPFDFAVRVEAWAADGTMHVSLQTPDGIDAPELEIETATLRTLPIRERLVEAEVAERTVVSEGREGLVVRVVRVDADGDREVTRQRYGAAARVIQVPAQVGPTVDAPATDAPVVPPVVVASL